MIRLCLFGPIVVEGPGGAVPTFEHPQALSLLAFLAAARPLGRHSQAEIAGLLWGRLPQDRALEALRKALAELQQKLGEGALLIHEDGSISLNDEQVTVDVRAFTKAIQSRTYDLALKAYAGEFLEDLFSPECAEFERWADDERSRLRGDALGAALQLAVDHERRLEHRAAAARIKWALRLAPTDDSLLQRLLRLLDAQGERTAALREFEDFRVRLEAQFASEPAPETLALVARIRDAVTKLDAGRPLTSKPGGSTTPGATAPDSGGDDLTFARISTALRERFVLFV
jgi:DNA-binding SARP family transcriptional activator